MVKEFVKQPSNSNLMDYTKYIIVLIPCNACSTTWFIKLMCIVIQNPAFVKFKPSAIRIA